MFGIFRRKMEGEEEKTRIQRTKVKKKKKITMNSKWRVGCLALTCAELSMHPNVLLNMYQQIQERREKGT